MFVCLSSTMCPFRSWLHKRWPNSNLFHQRTRSRMALNSIYASASRHIFQEISDDLTKFSVGMKLTASRDGSYVSMLPCSVVETFHIVVNSSSSCDSSNADYPRSRLQSVGFHKMTFCVTMSIQRASTVSHPHPENQVWTDHGFRNRPHVNTH